MQTLREARKNKGLSQSKLAALIDGYNQANISCIERGLTSPWPETKQKIESILDTNINWVVVPIKGKCRTKNEIQKLVKQLFSVLVNSPDNEKQQHKLIITKHLEKL